MLNVVPQCSAEDAKKYFSQSDYYSEGQEIVGNWGGKGAVLLGLFGEIDQKAFDSLCDNRHPQTGRPLTPITRNDRRVLYDFTWSAPKSISVVHALTGDERIVSAFRDSVTETMQEIEEEMQARVRRGNADTDRTTGNMVWAEFVHKTSRPVNGMPCPQLHIHAAAMNVTYDPTEEKWKAGQFGRIKGDGYYWQAVQQARFASKLQALGYGVRGTKDAFEIAGVPNDVISRFSMRTMQIEAVAKRLGITDPKVKAKLAATTREAKLGTIPYDELQARWTDMTTADERKAIRETAGEPVPVADESRRHVDFAIHHTFERSSVADERRLLALAMRRGIGSLTPETARKAITKAGLLRHRDGNRIMVTTEALLAEERKLLGFAVKGKGSCRPITASLPDNWEESLPITKFSNEQRRAVRHLLGSTDRLMILRGRAGTGKTTLTRVALNQMEAAGKGVVMVAPSANAARTVLRQEGFDQADTLARFLVDKNMQAAAKGGVIWVDEAGLVGSKTLVELFDKAKELDARVVLAGDRRQLAAVERGKPLQLLEDVAGLKAAELKEIFRQTGEYMEAAKLFGAGLAAQGVDKLNKLGWIKTLGVWDRYGEIARDFVEKLVAGRGDKNAALIVSPTHAEGEQVIAAVRAEMRSRGLLTGEEHVVRRLIPLQWSEAERGDRDQYAGDEIIQFHRNSGEFKAGERVRSSRMLASSRPPKAANFTTYREGTISLAAGDIVRVTAAGKTKDGGHRLDRGAIYAIDGFTPQGDIRLSNGYVLDKEFGHLASGVVSTVHASQGRTVQHVLVCQGRESLPAASKEGFYVAMSRGRQSVTIYTDSLADLSKSAEQSQRRMSATELAAKPRIEWWHRTRDRMERMRRNALIARKAMPAVEQRKTQEAAYAR